MIGDKKVLFSGMQATGSLTLGNYLGALKNWVSLSDEYECFYSVVDLHSITVRQDPAELRRRARNLLTLYIAAGLDPEKNYKDEETGKIYNGKTLMNAGLIFPEYREDFTSFKIHLTEI